MAQDRAGYRVQGLIELKLGANGVGTFGRGVADEVGGVVQIGVAGNGVQSQERGTGGDENDDDRSDPEPEIGIAGVRWLNGPRLSGDWGGEGHRATSAERRGSCCPFPLIWRGISQL